MVSSSCSGFVAVYTLPIFICWAYSLASILNRLPNFILEMNGTRPGKAETEGQEPTVQPGFSWPPGLEFCKARVQLALWCCLPMLGYAVIQGLSDCDQYDFCWRVEVQTSESHIRNLLHLLTASIILAWLCRVPPSNNKAGAVFTAVVVWEFFINKFTWNNCEEFMAHSLSAGSSFGFFDIFIAMTVMLSIVVLMCEGLPTLRRCCQKVFAQVGMTSGQERCELHLNSRGQRNYLIYWILIVVFHVGLFVIFSDVHVHHYWVGLVVGSCCIFQSPLSRLLLLKSVMMTIEGIGVWGADAIVGEDDGGMTEGDGNYRLALCVLVILAFMLAVGFNLYKDPRMKTLVSGMSTRSNQGRHGALDTE